MRGLDTNVLVRYLTADEPRQFASAARVIEDCAENEEQLYLAAIVLCELVWVLSRVYRQCCGNQSAFPKKYFSPLRSEI